MNRILRSLLVAADLMLRIYMGRSGERVKVLVNSIRSCKDTEDGAVLAVCRAQTTSLVKRSCANR